MEIVDTLVRSGAIDVLIVDSVAALVPKAELEGEMGDSHMGLQARLMSQALRKLTGAIKDSNTAMIFTNQLREKIGVKDGLIRLSRSPSTEIERGPLVVGILMECADPIRTPDELDWWAEGEP